MKRRITLVKKFFSIKDRPGNTGVVAKVDKKKVDPLLSYTPGKPDCEKCELHKTCKNPYLPIKGKGKKKILIIQEYPGSPEDIKNNVFIDKYSVHLEDALRKNTIYMKEDCWLTYANVCKPPTKKNKKDKKVTAKQVKCCRPLLMSTIQKLKPKYIWLLGNNTLTSILGQRHKYLDVQRWERICIPDQFLGSYLVTMYSPRHLWKSYNGKYDVDKSMSAMFDRQIKFAVGCLKKKFISKKSYKEDIELLYDFQNVIDLLLRVLKNNTSMVFDYETTGKKPYRPGHRIESISLCIEEDGFNKAYSFALEREGVWNKEQLAQILSIWIMILRNPDIKKKAHNAKYEELWSREQLKTKVEGWDACTMNTAHIIDDRQKYCGLKFQVFIHWGIDGYDWEVKHLLKVEKGEEFNRIQEIPLPKLLEYGAYDALFTKMLDDKQTVILSKTIGLKKANKFFFEGLKTFMAIEANGICADEDFYKSMDRRLTLRIQKIEDFLLKTEEALLFKQKTGRVLKFKSNKDLPDLLYDYLGLKSTKETAGGGRSVDAEALAGLKHPFVDKLLEKKRLEKAKGTYLAQFLREVHEGVIHPNFHLHTARTYRSSSSEPNFQNIPVRDNEIKAICRKGIIPSLDNRLFEIDYGQLEVKIVAC